MTTIDNIVLTENQRMAMLREEEQALGIQPLEYVSNAIVSARLSLLAPLFVAPISKGPSTSPSKADPHPIARQVEDLAGYVLTI